MFPHLSAPSLAAESMKTCVGLGLIHTHAYTHMNKYTHTHTYTVVLLYWPGFHGDRAPNLPAVCCTVGRGGGKWISVLVYIGACVCVCLEVYRSMC